MASKKKAARAVEVESSDGKSIQLTIRFKTDFIARVDQIAAVADFNPSRVDVIRWCAEQGVDAIEEKYGLKK